ncbi:MAG: hypothetical protein JRJ27_19605 [Deltaproteobacteria bacterium]|nr:hypothetical protein [Deltaproteobacteria bacterium]
MSKISYAGVSKIILLLFIFSLPSACSHYYVPKQHPVKAGMVPDFTGQKSIHIINAHETSNIKLFYVAGFHKYLGDMQLWTDTAVGVLRSELEIRNIPVKDTASKTITLKIAHANAYQGFASIRCIVTLEVETSEGHRKTFEGNNTSPWTLWRACDGAVTLAVTAMLNDDEILRFLKY